MPGVGSAGEKRREQGIAVEAWPALANNYRLQHRDAEARALFERLLSLRNDVGLLAEEYLALIMTALSLHDVGPAQQRGQGTRPIS
jgi:hypothetical protein